MAIEISCGECGREYRLTDDKAGMRFACKDCGAVIQIPNDPDDWDDDSEGQTDWEQMNPYSAPSGTSKGSSSRGGSKSSARERLAIPAIALIVVAVLSMLTVLLLQLVTLVNGPDPAAIPPDVDRNSYVAGWYFGVLAAMAIGLIMHIIVLYGANQMRTLGSKTWAWTGAIASIFPCCSCTIIGVPFAIWAMVVMSDPSVSSKFNS